MTAVEWFDEQIQERIIAQDVVARKLIIEISMEDYMDIKKQAKEMEKQQIIDAFGIGCHHESKRLVGYQEIAEQYYNETYGSKGSDDQVPDVRKMVEDDNYLTPVDWLMDRIKWIHRETYDYLIKEGQYDVAKRTENAILDKTNEIASSQTEISDEEIEKAAKFYKWKINQTFFEEGAKWYREQLKSKRNG